MIREKLMSGKILIEWRHKLCAEIAKTRYITQDICLSVHTEIANIFFNQFTDESEDTASEHSEKSGKIISLKL